MTERYVRPCTYNAIRALWLEASNVFWSMYDCYLIIITQFATAPDQYSFSTSCLTLS